MKNFITLTQEELKTLKGGNYTQVDVTVRKSNGAGIIDNAIFSESERPTGDDDKS
ncbi:MAG: hypothetical protein ACI8ZX_001390 [Planctomycetota bacterium]|jgi:hypothetical protein